MGNTHVSSWRPNKEADIVNVFSENEKKEKLREYFGAQAKFPQEPVHLCCRGVLKGTAGMKNDLHGQIEKSKRVSS